MGRVLIKNMEDFFDSYKEILQGEEDLVLGCEKFFIEFNNHVTADNMSAFFTSFPPLYEEDFRLGKECNIWGVVNLGTDELRVSRILAWLLDVNGSHGQGARFLNCLLPFIESEGITSSFLDKGGRVCLESLPLGEKESRVDIEIEGDDFLIFIEVKVMAQEGERQLERYCEIAQRKAGKKQKVAVLYLTRTGRKPKDEMLWDRVVSLSWAELGGELEKICNEKEIATNPYIGPIVSQYVDHVTDF